MLGDGMKYDNGQTIYRIVNYNNSVDVMDLMEITNISMTSLHFKSLPKP